MKNIHVLLTDKPSRLLIDTIENKLYYQPILHNKTVNVLTQHIYITSDEEIKIGDWVITPTKDIIQWAKVFQPDGKKIILTTDQDLIKDGVQEIPDEFLEWFVKNPSCEEVEVNHFGTCCGNQLIAQCINCTKYNPVYKIIIPKEATNKTHYLDELPNMDRDILAKMWESAVPKLEPKQETLEEATERLHPEEWDWREREIFIAGAKWQAERMYSEEDLRKSFHVGRLYQGREADTTFNEWFEQFKKK